MRTRLLMLIIATMLVSFACSDGDPEATPSSSTTTDAPTTSTSTSTTTTTVVDPAADQARAGELVLVTADLPSGWTVELAEPDDPSDTSDEELAACAGAPDPNTTETATVHGSTFRMGGLVSVSSTATFVKTLADAQADVAAIEGDKFIPCAEAGLTKSLQAEFEGQEVVVESLRVSAIMVPSVGQETLGFRVEMRLSVEGDAQLFFTDLVFIADGRAELSLEFFRADQPFDPALRDELIGKVGDKLAV
jgi:hypothetical protein